MSTDEQNPDDAIPITDLAPRDDVTGGAGQASGKLRLGEVPLKDLRPATPSPDEQERVKGGKPEFTPVPIPKPIDSSSP